MSKKERKPVATYSDSLTTAQILKAIIFCEPPTADLSEELNAIENTDKPCPVTGISHGTSTCRHS